MSYKSTRKTAKAKSVERIYQELDEMPAQARRKETLTAMVGVVLSGLRLLGNGIIKMVLEQRDDDMSEKRKGPPCCPKCGDKMWKPNKKETSRMTLLGKVRYRRRCYSCQQCHKMHSPLDSTLGLKALHRGHGELYNEMRSCIEYFEKHSGRMRYGYFRKRGLTIGSGAIESVHKWVVQAKMQTGVHGMVAT